MPTTKPDIIKPAGLPPAIEIAAAKTQGARAYQEDAELVRTFAHGPMQGLTLAVLADGMGGHAGGAIASKLACENFLIGFEQHRPTLSGRLVAGLEAANTAIAATVDTNPALQSMGSTLVGCAFTAAGLEWLSVGDSPLFLIRRSELAQLNEDHSLAPILDQMVAEGRMSRLAAENDNRRHMLRSAVTGEEIEMIDVSQAPLTLAPGDVVIVASDGIDTLLEPEVVDIVDTVRDDGGGATEIAAALIAAVDGHRRPHQDNTTVIVAVIR